MSPARVLRLQKQLLRRLQNRSFMYLSTLAIALAVASAIVHVSVRLQILRTGYELSEETRKHKDLIQQRERLRLELATRKDPASLEKRAKQLHMVPPDPTTVRVIHLQDSKGPPP